MSSNTPVLPFVDDIAAVRKYLADDAGVAALCGTRVYADELDAVEAAPMPRACVVVNDSGLGSGGGALGMTNNSYLPISTSTKDLRCYGATYAQSRAVWNACARALKDIGLNGRLLVVLADGTRIRLDSATPAAPATMREPTVDWPITFSTFNLTAAEHAV